MSSLESLQQTSLATLLSVQSHEVGFGKLPEHDASFEQTPLSDKENQLLDLYNQLEDLDIQIAIVKARDDVMEDDIPDEDLDKAIDNAKAEALEAKAACSLKQKIVEQVLITHPTLRAIHAGEHANYLERYG
jgi:hypothetical protein